MMMMMMTIIMISYKDDGRIGNVLPRA
jgi:hypothetical protein